MNTDTAPHCNRKLALVLDHHFIKTNSGSTTCIRLFESSKIPLKISLSFNSRDLITIRHREKTHKLKHRISYFCDVFICFVLLFLGCSRFQLFFSLRNLNFKKLGRNNIKNLTKTSTGYLQAHFNHNLTVQRETTIRERARENSRVRECSIDV